MQYSIYHKQIQVDLNMIKINYYRQNLITLNDYCRKERDEGTYFNNIYITTFKPIKMKVQLWFNFKGISFKGISLKEIGMN